MMLIIFTYFSIADSLVAYDCGSTKSKISELSLVDVDRCTPDTKNITTKNRVIQLIQPLIYQELPYFQCLIEVEHLTYRCGKTIDTFEKSSFTEELYEISKSDCARLIKDGIFEYQGKRIYIDKRLTINFISLETIGSIKDGSCTPGEPIFMNGVNYERPVRTSKFRISTHVGKGTIDLEESKLITEEGTRCHYQEESCFTASGGNTYWNTLFEKNTCHDGQYIPIYQGPATEVREFYKGKETISYILHYEKYDFQVILTGKKTITCGLISYMTEHPKLSVIPKEEDLPFVLSYDHHKLGKNVNMMTYLNTKLVYTVKHVKDQIENLYEKLMYSRCLAESKLIHAILSSASTSPHEFAYQYLKQEGYTASLRGEVIYIMKCEAVSVNFTSNPQGDCFNEIPVFYKGQQMYISPRSRLLSNVGTKIECSNVLPVKYKIMNTWFVSSPGGLIPSSSPKVMSISKTPDWEFEELNNFASAGIYTQEDLDKIDKIILTSIRSDAITAQVNRAIAGEGQLSSNLQVINLMNPDELERLGKSKLNEFLDKVYLRLGHFGNIVSTVIGLVIILKSFLFLINSIINIHVLNRVFGLSWRLLFCWWENIVNIFLHSENTNKNNSIERMNKNSDETPFLNSIERGDLPSPREQKVEIDLKTFNFSKV